MTTQTETAKEKQAPDFYLFESGAMGQKSGRFAGTVYAHKKGKGFTVLRFSL